MKKKLSEWAKEQNLPYLTCYRWFKANRLPIAATQLPSGMIMVDEAGTYMKTEKNEAISELLKKTTELSKNNGTVEDLAAYVVSNFNLQIAKDDEKNDLKSLLKNDGGEGTFMKSSKNPSISLNSSLSDFSWNSQIQAQPTGNLMAWNGNPNFGQSFSVSAQTEPDLSIYGSQNVSCGGGLISDNSIFYTGPTTTNLSDILGIEDQKETAAQNPETPQKRGRGRPKKIQGEKK